MSATTCKICGQHLISIEATVELLGRDNSRDHRGEPYDASLACRWLLSRALGADVECIVGLLVRSQLLVAGATP
jgi:hypothetical protein